MKKETNYIERPEIKDRLKQFLLNVIDDPDYTKDLKLKASEQLIKMTSIGYMGS